MVSGIHSRHTIRSEIAKWRRNSWTEFLWPRRRKAVITAATTPLPITPMIRISPEKETVTFHLVAQLAFFFCLPASTKSLPKGVSLVLFWYFLLMQENPRLSCILDSTPWIPFFRYRVPDFLSVELGFRIPIFSWWDFRFLELYSGFVILLHEKFLQFDWLRAVVFQPNLKNLHVKKKMDFLFECQCI